MCEDVCPRDLAPQDLYWYRDNTTKLDALDLAECIECGRCDRVCPSNIPLTDIFKSAKLEQQQQIEQVNRAQHARMRYEDHLERVAAWSHKVKQRPSAGETASLLDAIRQKRM
jgi:electron transport complex protein RnfC